MAYKKWVVGATDKAHAIKLAQECDVDPFVALIAASRGYSEPAELEELLADEPLYSSPYELPDMEKAVAAINKAIEDDTIIAVFGDYDCDGITATAVLYGYLKKRGVRCVYYIPDRIDEGYGMTPAAIDKLYSQGVGLIITVDNGISCATEVEYAASLGIKTVVTDHHLPPEVLPDAEAVVDPHIKGSAVEFKDISGVFVAFKLVCALDNSEPEQLAPIYSDLVAIGLIADIMPLKHENRDIVKQGIKAINTTSKVGIVALLNSAGIKRGDVTAGKVSFGIAPRINAAGRMNSADIALKLLLSEDFHEAVALAEQLEQFNAERQKTEQNISSEAFAIIENSGLMYNHVIVVSGKNWHKGVVGIVASRIVERYGKPALVLSEDESGEISGSGRSISGFSLYDAIAFCADDLIRFGGHELAAGVSMSADNFDKFCRRINQYASALPPLDAVLKLECRLNPAGMSIDLADAIKQLEPFGMGNPTPLFGVYNLELQRIVPLGQNRHCKLLLCKDGNVLEALAFSVSPDAVPFDVGDKIDIAVTLDINEFGGKRGLSVVIKNWRTSGINQDALFDDIRLYEAFKRSEKINFSQIQREEIGEVYRYLVKAATPEKIRQHFIGSLGYFKTMVAIDVLEELGIISLYTSAGTKTYKSVSGVKADLNNSKILKSIREG